MKQTPAAVLRESSVCTGALMCHQGFGKDLRGKSQTSDDAADHVGDLCVRGGRLCPATAEDDAEGEGS